jgi:hypothetical protein
MREGRASGYSGWSTWPLLTPSLMVLLLTKALDNAAAVGVALAGHAALVLGVIRTPAALTDGLVLGALAKGGSKGAGAGAGAGKREKSFDRMVGQL